MFYWFVKLVFLSCEKTLKLKLRTIKKQSCLPLGERIVSYSSNSILKQFSSGDSYLAGIDTLKKPLLAHFFFMNSGFLFTSLDKLCRSSP